MNAAEQNTKKGMEESDVIKQFMELLSQQNMGEQSQGFMEMFRYVAGMQLQLSVMADELQGMREQLVQLQESQPKAVTERLMDKAAQLQEKVTSLSERLSEVKENIWWKRRQRRSVPLRKRGKKRCVRWYRKVCPVLSRCLQAIRKTTGG